MSAAPPVYAQARAETAAMLGYDLANLSAEQATRLDVCAALRLVVDDQGGKLARGETTDVAKLLSASEALARLLPPLREPPAPVDNVDPRTVMWETYLGMRRRGELAASYLSPQQRLEAARAKVAEIEAELAALAPPPDEPGASSGANAPVSAVSAPNGAVGDNVVPLSRSAGSRTTPQPPTPAPRNWDDTPGGQAWHAWRDAGGYVPDY
jgi:hypothetical protein